MVSVDKIKTSLIEEVGVPESMATRFACSVMELLKEHKEYEEFYYRVLPNNKIYFFIRKKLNENSYIPIILNKGGFEINDKARAN